MPRVTFTHALQRHIALPPVDVAGETVREVLDAVFAANERARGYILDDRGSMRQHMVIFINGEPIKDREDLTDVVPADGEVYVMQALSGG